jgi:hypothetical protein
MAAGQLYCKSRDILLFITCHHMMRPVILPYNLPGSHTCATHAKNLSSAIYQPEAVAKQLSKVSGDIWTTTNSLQVSRLRS